MSIQQSIASRLADKVSKNVGHRVDMSISDYYQLNSTSARFMLEYENKHPTSEEVTDFFIRKFGGKVTPDMSTAKVIQKESVIVVVANIVNYHRPVDDSKKMKTVIAGYQYFDEALQETWEVKDVNGHKVLARKLRDDITSIVEARRKAMMNKSTNKTFASLKATSALVRSISLVGVGDIVKAYHNGKQYDNCEVTKVGADTAELKTSAGNLKVDKSQILEVVAKSEEAIVAEDEKLVEYFTKAYGDPEYAKKLVQK